MLFSENKLRELASLRKNIKTEEILNAINSIGFEVESCKKISDVHGIKFGHILKTYKNIKSNNLNVCEIEFEDKNRIIQTTASNVREGDYIVAFVPGSGIGEVIFGAKEMKGVVSEGMLTSLGELGFNEILMRKEWNDGIFIFDKISLKKDPIIELGLDDNIIDVSILTNRSDANSYIVMALELAAFFKTKPYTFSTIKSTKKTNIKMRSIKNNYISGIDVNIEKFKMDLEDIILLLKTNITLENDVKDLSSLTLIMTGVSSRVYNAEKISGEITLDIEKSFEFNGAKIENSLVVKDKKNILSIAGILESLEYKYKKGDENVLFEFASLNPQEVRKSSRIIKITNESSINSSKCVSQGSIEFAIKFISSKVKVFSNQINQLSFNPKSIVFDAKYLNKFAGFDITKSDKYHDCLRSLDILGFKISDGLIFIPSYRHDIETMQDVVEEIFRFYGLNNFNESQPSVKFNSNNISPIKDFALICSIMGYLQFWTYTLIKKEKNDFNPFSFKNKISLLTYVSEEHNSIRNSIAPSLEEVYNYNNKRKMNNFNFFDMGMINNRKALCIASDIKTYSQIKEDIFKIYGKPLEIKPLNLEFIHPNYNAGLFDGEIQVGWIGKIHPQNTKNNLIFAEIIINQNTKNDNKFEDYDRSPLKERDITIPLKKNESIKDYLIKFKKIVGIYEIKEKDCFEKDGIKYFTFNIKMNDDALIEFDDKFNI